MMAWVRNDPSTVSVTKNSSCDHRTTRHAIIRSTFTVLSESQELEKLRQDALHNNE